MTHFPRIVVVVGILPVFAEFGERRGLAAGSGYNIICIFAEFGEGRGCLQRVYYLDLLSLERGGGCRQRVYYMYLPILERGGAVCSGYITCILLSLERGGGCWQRVYYLSLRSLERGGVCWQRVYYLQGCRSVFEIGGAKFEKISRVTTERAKSPTLACPEVLLCAH